MIEAGVSAEKEILVAWREYRRVEKYGLAFGEVCYRWQQKFRKQGSRTGLGLRPILNKVGVPASTTYFWINRYRESAGLKRSRVRIDAPAPLPSGVFRILYADPPWRYQPGMPENYGLAENHYSTLPTEEICAMPLPVMADDAVLFLWATVPLLREALKVVDAWGFAYKSNFVWDKVNHNFGRFVSVRHELLLIATHGSCMPEGRHLDQTEVLRTKLFDSVQTIRRTEHSRKPERFREIIDSMYPSGARIELFARGALPAHWDGYGNEYQKLTA